MGRIASLSIPEFPDALEEPPPRQGFFEHSAYLAVAAHLPDDYRDVFDFGYWTGWRKNREVQTLVWDMVDLEANELRLTPAFSKTKAGRVVPIIVPLREVLLRRLAKQRRDCPFVFHREGRRIGDWRRVWKRACEAAGHAGLRYHDLRRTVARNLDRAGVPRGVAMQMIGHKTENVYRRYNITSRRDLDIAKRLYEDYMTNQPTTNNVVSWPISAVDRVRPA
jgi:integrase